MRRRWDGPLFGVGLNVGRAEFRSTDLAGSPVDVAAETETARTERVLKLQDRRVADGPREGPLSASPVAIINELCMHDPDMRMSAFVLRLAQDPSLVPVMAIEAPGRPSPDMAAFARMNRSGPGTIQFNVARRMD